MAGAFKTVLIEKYELARADSEKTTKANAEKLGPASTYFTTSTGFGEEVAAPAEKVDEQAD